MPRVKELHNNKSQETRKFLVLLKRKQKRTNLETLLLQVAKEKVRKIDSAFYRDDNIPLPTRTPISQIINDNIEYMRTRKTP